MHRTLRVWMMTLMMLGTGCVWRENGASCRSGEQAGAVDTLYFGTAMPNGRVTVRDWEAFLASNALTSGLTHWMAAGIWTSPQGRKLEEDVHVVQVVHTNTERMNQRIGQMMARYRTQFGQDAVLRSHAPICASGSNLD